MGNGEESNQYPIPNLDKSRGKKAVLVRSKLKVFLKVFASHRLIE